MEQSDLGYGVAVDPNSTLLLGLRKKGILMSM
jgi:hypothetical protein